MSQLTEITQFIFGQPLSLEDTSPPWSADAARPECGHYWRRPRDSEPPGHGAHSGPMCRAAENHSRNPSWPASLPWLTPRGTRPRQPRHPAAPARIFQAQDRRDRRLLAGFTNVYTSLGYQLASIIAGGPSAFIATALFATFHSSPRIALYILGCGAIGLVSVLLLTDYTNRD